ncbi:MAG TPA: putative glycoside hydrolase [Gaiellales bacterium]|nr:putative glycoside hydrolase [Gaiellales bacterium]
MLPRAGLLLRACLPLRLVALAATGSAPAGAAIATSSGIHAWLFDGTHTLVDTVAEARDVARRDDIVVGVSRYATYLRAMKGTRPGILIAEYHKGTTVKADFAWVEANHPDWLLRDANGNLLQSSWGGYLINPALPAVRTWEADYAKSQQAKGWTAVYLDSLGTMAFYGFPSRPINPATGSEFTVAEWLTATTGLASAVSSAVRIPVIGNGLNNGTRYITRTHVLLDGLDGGVFEGCFRDATDPVSAWPSPTDWLNQVRAIAAVQGRGKLALCLTKLWAPATTAQRHRWRTFTLASYLLAKGGTGYYMFMGSRKQGALSTWNTGWPRIGRATGARVQVGAIWERPFSGGIVAVNPSGTTRTLALHSTYLTPSGHAVTSIQLAPHSGTVLTN